MSVCVCDCVCVCAIVCVRARARAIVCVCVPCACLTVALVHQFMKSPAYTVPVVDFIDENCLAFDNEEESKLELSAIHNKFIEHPTPGRSDINFCILHIRSNSKRRSWKIGD